MNRRLRNTPAQYHGRIGFPARRSNVSSLFDNMYRDMNDMFSRAQQLWDEDDEHGERSLASFAHSPAVDFEEEDDTYHLSLELPGMKAEDVDVDVTDGVLRISGEKRTKREDKEDGRSFRERSYGRFSRSMKLPGNIDEDRIEASFEDGVLELTLPKQEEAQSQSRKIEISGSRQIESNTASASTGDEPEDTRS